MKLASENENQRVSRSDAILRLPYARLIVPESDGTFRAEIMEFPGCIATGQSAPAALSALEDVAAAWIKAALEAGQPIPPPIETDNSFSGRLVLRIPKSLHKKATLIAERDGVSLNQFITSALSVSVGEKYNSQATAYVTSASIFSYTVFASSGVSGQVLPLGYTAQSFHSNNIDLLSGSGYGVLPGMAASGKLYSSNTVSLSAIARAINE